MTVYGRAIIINRPVSEVSWYSDPATRRSGTSTSSRSNGDAANARVGSRIAFVAQFLGRRLAYPTSSSN
jgi:hypothetical protein